MSDKTKAILAELRRRFEQAYGDRLVKMVLFGSQARGDADEGSDIDVLVVLKGPVSPSTEIDRAVDHRVDILLKEGELVSCVFVSEEEFGHEQSPLMVNVRREGVIA